MRNQVKEHKRQLCAGLCPLAALNVAFSYPGLQTILDNVDDLGDQPFIDGQYARAEAHLNDDTTTWLDEYKGLIHGVFIITGSDKESVDNKIRELEDGLGSSITKVYRRDCSVREGGIGCDDLKEFNHFGWRDGFTQLFISYYDDIECQRFPYPGQPIIQDPGVLVIRGADRPEWARNGSLLAFRHLRLLVPEFDNYLNSIATKLILNPVLSPKSTDVDSEIRKRAELIGARFNGRWKSGAPLVLAPFEDDSALGCDPDRRSNFRDFPRNQNYCPFAAHMRKTAPRSDNPGELEAHAIARSGLHYGGELTEEEIRDNKTIEDRGLGFACYQSSLEQGFEHMQKQCNNPQGEWVVIITVLFTLP
ncbi:hypothetical protein AX14_005275 [Amanita brunnescens Koide BX004]|nr:hypothetical protein AX14_005275 [Amanita brunnescens Koide BX004]